MRLAGANAADLLDMTAARASAHLAAHPAIAARLAALERVGLGYLRLGQATATLSGGELQRLRLTPLLASAGGEGTMVLLDEPTRGLHHRDVARLAEALRELVAAGAAVVVVEHDLDVVAAADHVIELGPGGGPNGGRIVAAGPPAELVRAGTATGRALAGRPS